MYFEWLNTYTVGPSPLLCNGSFFSSRRTMKNPSIQFLLTSTCLLWGGSTVYALIHSGFPFLKWSCSRKLKFLSYSHPSQLVPSTSVSMVPFRMRPSRCFVLILSLAPSPSDASHSGYCKHKRLTVIIMAIIRYELEKNKKKNIKKHNKKQKKKQKQKQKQSVSSGQVQVSFLWPQCVCCGEV